MSVIALPEIIEFEWDEGNEQKNWIKHKVSAKEAEEPFLTEEQLILDDIRHSTKGEKRYVLTWESNQGRILFIVYIIRNEKVRIISARDADRKEVLLYEKALNLTRV
jgi:uncharacterized protein